MKIKKKRCCVCRRWFAPDPRVAHREFLYCPKSVCRQQGKKEARARWLDKNPGYHKGQARRIKVKRWAEDYPDYWKNWRLNHEEYVARNRQQQKQRDHKRRFLAKQDQMAQNPLGHIESIRLLARNNLAKQDQISRSIEGILDFLAVKERLAKQELMAPGAFAGA